MNYGIKIAAGDVTVGMELAAGDGYLFTVRATERNGAFVTLTLGSDFSPMRSIRDGVTKRFRASSVLIRSKTAEELAAEGRY